MTGAVSIGAIPSHTGIPAGAPELWTPAKLSNKVLWIRPVSLQGLADTSSLTTWPDESGQGNDPTQGTADNRPTVQTNELNGFSVVRFDGTNDVLAVTLGAEISAPNTVLAVTKSRLTTVATNEYYVGCRNSADAISSTIFANASGTDDFSFYSGTEVRTGVALDADFHYWVLLVNGASSVLRKDGTDFSSDVGSLAIHEMGIGARADGNSFLDGDMAEVVIVNGALTTSELNLWDAYASALYAL